MSNLLKLNGKPTLGHSFSSLQSFLVCLESSHTVNRFKMSQSNVRVFDIEEKKITLGAVTWKPIIKQDEGVMFQIQRQDLKDGSSHRLQCLLVWFLKWSTYASLLSLMKMQHLVRADLRHFLSTGNSLQIIAWRIA